VRQTVSACWQRPPENKKDYPGIHYHISSGNRTFVTECLDKVFLDFGLVFGTPDLKNMMHYSSPIKTHEVSSCEKTTSSPGKMPSLQRISLDRIINTSGNSNLAFRPFPQTAYFNIPKNLKDSKKSPLIF
jgi:hypothetical protein